MDIKSELTGKNFNPYKWDFPCACGMFAILAEKSFEMGDRTELINSLIDAGVFCGLPKTKEIVTRVRDASEDELKKIKADWLDSLEKCALKVGQ